MFNLLGPLWIPLVFARYIKLVSGTVALVHRADSLTFALAWGMDPLEFATVVTASTRLTHAGLKVVNTEAFLPFIMPCTRMLERLDPGPRMEEVARLKRTEVGTVASPVLGLEQSRGEIIQMGHGTIKLMEWIRQLGFHGPWDELLVRKTFLP